MAVNLRRIQWISQSNLHLYNLINYANNFKKIKLVLDIPFVTANLVAACGVLYPDTWPSYSTDYRYVVYDHSSKMVAVLLLVEVFLKLRC
jgi:hypothetical protein